MLLILSSHASSNTYCKLANTLIVFGLGLAFVTGAGQLTAAQMYLSSKPFSTPHAQHRYSITLSSASFTSNDICDDIDMAHINASATTAPPSTNESISSAFPSDLAHSSSSKAGSISIEDKIHHELLLVVMQKEELRRVEEENEMLHRMIEAYSR